MNIKTIRRGLAILAILGVTSASGIAVASAATRPWDGKDPSLTRCQRDRILIKKAPIRSTFMDTRARTFPARHLGEVQLYYSPKCRTAWGRVVNLTRPSVANVRVIRATDDKTYSCTIVNRNQSPCHTAMVNDANTSAKAIGEITYQGKVFRAETGSY